MIRMGEMGIGWIQTLAIVLRTTSTIKQIVIAIVNSKFLQRLQIEVAGTK